jgi:hypothetical protein
MQLLFFEFSKKRKENKNPKYANVTFRILKKKKKTEKPQVCKCYFSNSQNKKTEKPQVWNCYFSNSQKKKRQQKNPSMDGINVELLNIVAHKPAAKRRLCKQRLLLGNASNIHARNNRKAVFSMLSVPR